MVRCDTQYQVSFIADQAKTWSSSVSCTTHTVLGTVLALSDALQEDTILRNLLTEASGDRIPYLREGGK